MLALDSRPAPPAWLGYISAGHERKGNPDGDTCANKAEMTAPLVATLKPH